MKKLNNKVIKGGVSPTTNKVKLLLADLFSINMDFKDGEEKKYINNLISAIEKSPEIRNFEKKEHFYFDTSCKKENIQIKFNDSLNGIEGHLEYYAPGSPNPNHPVAGIGAEFKRIGEVSEKEWVELYNIVDRWNN